MQTQSPKRRVARILLPLLLMPASSCAERAIAVQSYPPNADVEAVTAPKPQPTPDIVTDPQANARYNAAVESWGDTIHSAGVRICQWAQQSGAKLSFLCDRKQP